MLPIFSSLWKFFGCSLHPRFVFWNFTKICLELQVFIIHCARNRAGPFNAQLSVLPFWKFSLTLKISSLCFTCLFFLELLSHILELFNQGSNFLFSLPLSAKLALYLPTFLILVLNFLYLYQFPIGCPSFPNIFTRAWSHLLSKHVSVEFVMLSSFLPILHCFYLLYVALFCLFGLCLSSETLLFDELQPPSTFQCKSAQKFCVWKDPSLAALRWGLSYSISTFPSFPFQRNPHLGTHPSASSTLLSDALSDLQTSSPESKAPISN